MALSVGPAADAAAEEEDVTAAEYEVIGSNFRFFEAPDSFLARFCSEDVSAVPFSSDGTSSAADTTSRPIRVTAAWRVTSAGRDALGKHWR